MRARFENTVTALVVLVAMVVLTAAAISIVELSIAVGPLAGGAALVLTILGGALVSDLLRGRK